MPLAASVGGSDCNRTKSNEAKTSDKIARNLDRERKRVVLTDRSRWTDKGYQHHCDGQPELAERRK